MDWQGIVLFSIIAFYARRYYHAMGLDRRADYFPFLAWMGAAGLLWGDNGMVTVCVFMLVILIAVDDQPEEEPRRPVKRRA